MSNDLTIDRLSAYLDDELLPEEREALEQQLESSESLREELETLRQVRDWFREYPGRKPRKDAWQRIASRVTAMEESNDDIWRDEPTPRRHRTGLMAFLPAFVWAPMPTTLKRLGIGALVAVALGGMGRQFVLEQRADELEQISVFRDIQLFEYANAAKWNQNAVQFRDQIGLRMSLVCPPQGQLAALWGTGVYTDDSSICSAAVHSGVITQEHGGLVTFEVQDGLSEYRGSSSNGVESRSIGQWDGSFVILPNDDSLRNVNVLEAGIVSWETSPLDLRGMNGTIVNMSCPAGGENSGPIFGTDTYTDDSPICTAGVHAGLVTFEDGGDVTIRIIPGFSEYEGTSRNGVVSLDYSEWLGSFVFVDEESMSSDQAQLSREERRKQYQYQYRFHRQMQVQAQALVQQQVRAQVQQQVQAQMQPQMQPQVQAQVQQQVQQQVWAQVQQQVQQQVQAQAQAQARMNVGPGVAVDSEHGLIHNLTADLGEVGWRSTALDMRDWIGFRADLSCPPDGSPADVWGTDAYSVSSSICTAAVHAGIITFDNGGPVTIEVFPGLSSYQGTSRYGVTTKTSGTSTSGSSCFRFVMN